MLCESSSLLLYFELVSDAFDQTQTLLVAHHELLQVPLPALPQALDFVVDLLLFVAVLAAFVVGETGTAVGVHVHHVLLG